jgi:hypothetical protein
MHKVKIKKNCIIYLLSQKIYVETQWQSNHAYQIPSKLTMQNPVDVLRDQKSVGVGPT